MNRSRTEADTAVGEGGSSRILVTGASGYIGGRLVPDLIARGHLVRCLVRTSHKLDSAPWRSQAEVVEGDIGGDLTLAMAGVDVAVFLVHSIGDGPDWMTRELRHAENFRRAAERAGVSRLVYLGGLGDDSAALSDHLRSRHRVGQILAGGTVPVAELRAAVVIGSGSASFEMLRYLTEVLPVMVTPKWVRTRCQPISVRDVLRYLVAVIEHPNPVGGVLEIGGPDVVSYADMMGIYAQEAGLARRRLIPVPLLTPRLSSHWVGLVTPVPASLARPLVASLVNTVVVTDERAAQLFPFERVPLRFAIRQAIGGATASEVATSFDDAAFPVWQALPTDPAWSGGTELTDTRAKIVNADPTRTWQAVCRVGGARGWYGGEVLWRIRGWLDQLAGGPGLRRGRRHPDRLAVGEPLDFWRVQDIDEQQSLTLHAEMRLPGEAWLEWTLRPVAAGTELVQTARFRPRGLLGRIYWYLVMPFHRIVFPALLDGIAHDAERAGTSPTPPHQARTDTGDDRSRRPSDFASREPLHD